MAVFANRLAAAMFCAVVMAFPASALRAQEAAVAIPAPTIDEAAKGNVEKAIFAGGCFWGVQGVFQHVKGVSNAVSGYSGGDQKTATYETVSSGKSGHAEAVEITFDPKQVSYCRSSFPSPTIRPS